MVCSRGGQRAAELLEAGGDRRVDDPVSDLQDEAAEDGGVDLEVEGHLAAEAVGEPTRQLSPLLGREVDGRDGGGANPPGRLVDQLLEL